MTDKEGRELTRDLAREYVDGLRDRVRELEKRVAELEAIIVRMRSAGNGRKAR